MDFRQITQKKAFYQIYKKIQNQDLDFDALIDICDTIGK